MAEPAVDQRPSFRVTIEGETYRVRANSHQEALQAVQAMRASQAKPEQGTLGGMAKSVGTGIARGVTELPMLPVTVARAAGAVLAPGMNAFYALQGRQPPANNPITEPIYRAQDAIRQTRDEALYQPQGRMERAAANIAEMTVPGAMLRRPLRLGLIPGVVSETAGQLTEGTPLEPAARIAGAFVGTGIGGLSARARTASQALRARLPRGTTEQDIAKAEILIAQAQRQGVPVTWPEALAKVTNGRVDITDVQRVIEQSRGGGPTMAAMMSERPGQAARAVDRELTQWSMGRQPMDPQRAGTRIQEMADQEVTRLRQTINRLTEPLYRQGGQAMVPEPDFRALMKDPLFRRTLADVRRDPVYSRSIQGFPDRSVQVFNSVKKRLDDMAGRSSVQGENEAASVYGGVRDDVRDVATRTSPEYRQALDVQTTLRRGVLEPNEQGMLGQMARTPDLRRQGEILLPSQPVEGTERVVGETVRRLVRNDPEAATQLVRSYIRRIADETMKAKPSGPNQWGGANFAAALRGNAQEGKNLREAVLALPDGPARWNGFQELLRVLETTGRRKQPGSQTAQNLRLEEELQRSGPVGAVVTAPTRGLNFAEGLRDRYQEWRLGKNTQQIADVLTDPASGALFRRLLDARTIPEKQRIAGLIIYQGSEMLQGQMGMPVPPIIPRLPLQDAARLPPP